MRSVFIWDNSANIHVFWFFVIVNVAMSSFGFRKRRLWLMFTALFIFHCLHFRLSHDPHSEDLNTRDFVLILKIFLGNKIKKNLCEKIIRRMRLFYLEHSYLIVFQLFSWSCASIILWIAFAEYHSCFFSVITFSLSLSLGLYNSIPRITFDAISEILLGSCGTSMKLPSANRPFVSFSRLKGSLEWFSKWCKSLTIKMVDLKNSQAKIINLKPALAVNIA